jgi:hypothetical protein
MLQRCYQLVNEAKASLRAFRAIEPRFNHFSSIPD